MSNHSNINSIIELLRFYFMFVICIFHYEHITKGVANGYIAVEFFFILSGVLLYKSYLRNENLPLFDFAKRRFWRFQAGGKFLIATLCTYLANILWQIYKHADIPVTNTIFSFFSEILLLKGLGLLGNPVNGPCWYVSTLLFSSLIVFNIFKHEDRISVSTLLLVTSIVSYSFILNICKLSDVLDNTYRAFYLPLLRAYAGVSLGGAIAKIMDDNKELILPYRKTLTSVFCVSFFFISLGLLSDSETLVCRFTEPYFILLFVILIVGIYSGVEIQNNIIRRLSKFLGGITYEMLLIHTLCLYFVHFMQKLLTLNHSIWVIIYIVCVIGFSYLLHTFGNEYRTKTN